MSAAGPALSGAAGVAGQKLDSGLGELPHYSRWADSTGKAPAGRLALFGPAAR